MGQNVYFSQPAGGLALREPAVHVATLLCSQPHINARQQSPPATVDPSIKIGTRTQFSWSTSGADVSIPPISLVLPILAAPADGSMHEHVKAVCSAVFCALDTSPQTTMNAVLEMLVRVLIQTWPTESSLCRYDAASPLTLMRQVTGSQNSFDSH